MGIIEEKGNRYNRLTVLKFVETNRCRKRTWLCRCDCGKELVVVGQHLRNGNTQSCGCFQLDQARAAATRHGQSRVGKRTAAYEMWLHAKARASKINVPFNLRLEDIPPFPERCPVFGIILERGTSKRKDSSPSLDRIIPEFGYTRGNVRVISWRANSLRSNASLQELRMLLRDAEKLLS